MLKEPKEIPFPAKNISHWFASSFSYSVGAGLSIYCFAQHISPSFAHFAAWAELIKPVNMLEFWVLTLMPSAFLLSLHLLASTHLENKYHVLERYSLEILQRSLEILRRSSRDPRDPPEILRRSPPEILRRSLRYHSEIFCRSSGDPPEILKISFRDPWGSYEIINFLIENSVQFM